MAAAVPRHYIFQKGNFHGDDAVLGKEKGPMWAWRALCIHFLARASLKGWGAMLAGHSDSAHLGDCWTWSWAQAGYLAEVSEGGLQGRSGRPGLKTPAGLLESFRRLEKNWACVKEFMSHDCPALTKLWEENGSCQRGCDESRCAVSSTLYLFTLTRGWDISSMMFWVLGRKGGAAQLQWLETRFVAHVTGNRIVHAEVTN